MRPIVLNFMDLHHFHEGSFWSLDVYVGRVGGVMRRLRAICCWTSRRRRQWSIHRDIILDTL